MYLVNRYGDKTPPCLVPLAMKKVPDLYPNNRRLLKWRSNRLCRLCSAQGPRGIQGPPTAWAVIFDYSCCTISLLQSPECIKVQHFEGQHRKIFLGPQTHTHNFFNKFTPMNSCDQGLKWGGMGPQKNFSVLSFEMLNFYAFWILEQGDSTATVIKIFMTSAH